jgi:hypothetical protein
VTEALPREQSDKDKSPPSRFGPFAVCAATIAALSLTPNPRQTQLVGILEMVGGELWAHGVAWAALGLSARWARVTREDTGRASALAWCVCVGYGVLMEGLQYFVPGRGAQVVDLLADAAGATAGVVLMNMWMNRSRDHDQA